MDIAPRERVDGIFIPGTPAGGQGDPELLARASGRLVWDLDHYLGGIEHLCDDPRYEGEEWHAYLLIVAEEARLLRKRMNFLRQALKNPREREDGGERAVGGDS